MGKHMADFRPNVIRANVLGKHVRVSRGSTDLTVVNRNLSLLLEARNLLAEFNAWAQTHGIKDLTDSDYFKALVQLQRQVEADSQRASLLRSSSEVSEAIEPPKPRPCRPLRERTASTSISTPPERPQGVASVR